MLDNISAISPQSHEFATEVLQGLDSDNKTLPCRFLYDSKGSELFEEITDLDEYYPTRTEITLLQTHAREIAEIAGENTTLIEFGSGSSRKTKYLIKSLEDISSYIPIDISSSALKEAEQDLQSHFPELEISPLHADFLKPMEIQDNEDSSYRLGFFPGSTIGNFEKDDAITFLRTAREILGNESGLIIGVDLQKDLDILIPAYNDAKGVTAEFNLNILRRINNELDGNIDLETFRHKAIYNKQAQRIEMHLESQKDQNTSILGKNISFSKGETIHTENSHKYTIESFRNLAQKAGWKPLKHWTDQAKLFSIHYLLPDRN